MDLQLTAVCRWCGAGPLRAVYPFTITEPLADFSPSQFQIQQCDACGSWQVNPHPSHEASKKFFSSPERWLSGRDPDRLMVNPLDRAEKRKLEYQIYAQAMTAYLPESGAVMDIGAGTGLMLSLLAVPNPKIAVEPNILAAKLAGERGLKVINQWAEDLVAPKKPLAAIILNQTIDHLSRPDLFLFKALNWLAPGGLLLLGNLINPKCLAARIYGPNFRLFHPFHQVYPTPKAVNRVLTPFGFEIIEIWRPYFKTPYGSIPKFLASASAMALRFLRLTPSGPSPAFIGNTVTYLARKTLLYRTISVKNQIPSSLPC